MTSAAALFAPAGARADCAANGGFPTLQGGFGAASLAPFGNGGAVSALVSAINASNTAFLTQSSAFVGAPGNPQPGQSGGGVWTRGVGGQSDFKATATSTYSQGGEQIQGGVACNTTTRFNFGGVQIGTDISQLNIDGWNLHFGGTLGYLGGGAADISRGGPLDPAGGSFGDTLQVPFAGFYAAVTKGGLFIDGQVKWSYYQNKLSDPSQSGVFGQHLDSRGVALTGNIGYNIRLSENWFIEPSAGILWSRVETDPLAVSGTLGLTNNVTAALNSGNFANLSAPGTVSIGAITNTMARVSLRAGVNVNVGGVNVQPFATISGFHDFIGSQSATINTNFASIFGPGIIQEISGKLTTTGVGSYGQFGVGAAAQIPDTGWLGYLRADYRTGPKIDGWNVAAGVRYQLAPEVAAGVRKAETAAPDAIAYDWTGFYLGPSLGADWGYTNWNFSRVDTTTSPRFAGVLPGGQVGFNYQMGKWVAGVEGDMGWTNAHGARACPNGFFFTCEANTNWLSTIAGRIGYAYWDRVLFYGKGGVAIGQIRSQIRCNTSDQPVLFVLSGASDNMSLLNPGCPLQGATNTAVGWTLALGTELGLTENWSVKGEASYFNLGTGHYTYGFGPGAPLEVDVKRNGFIANIGLNYRFSGLTPPVLAARD